MKDFTLRARRVVEVASQIAAECDHTYIGTEHLLLALLRVNKGQVGQLLNGIHAMKEEQVTKLFFGE